MGLCCLQGKLRLVSSSAADGKDESEVLRLAAAVEGSTRHPVADAVLLAARKAHLQVICYIFLTCHALHAAAQHQNLHCMHGRTRRILHHSIGKFENQMTCVCMRWQTSFPFPLSCMIWDVVMCCHSQCVLIEVFASTMSEYFNVSHKIS